MYKIGLSSNIEDYFGGEYKQYVFETYEQAKAFVVTVIESTDEEQRQYCFTPKTEGITWYFPSCNELGEMNFNYDIDKDVIECYLLLFILGEGEENEGYNTTSWHDSYRREYRINREGNIFWDSEWIPNIN